MAISDQSKPIITMDAQGQQLDGNPFIDYLVYTVNNSGLAGDQCVVEDKNNKPVARFPVDGPNHVGIRWINHRIEGLQIVTMDGTGGILYVHIRN